MGGKVNSCVTVGEGEDIDGVGGGDGDEGGGGGADDDGIRGGEGGGGGGDGGVESFSLSGSFWDGRTGCFVCILTEACFLILPNSL